MSISRKPQKSLPEIVPIAIAVGQFDGDVQNIKLSNYTPQNAPIQVVDKNHPDKKVFVMS